MFESLKITLGCMWDTLELSEGTGNVSLPVVMRDRVRRKCFFKAFIAGMSERGVSEVSEARLISWRVGSQPRRSPHRGITASYSCTASHAQVAHATVSSNIDLLSTRTTESSHVMNFWSQTSLPEGTRRTEETTC